MFSTIAGFLGKTLFSKSSALLLPLLLLIAIFLIWNFDTIATGLGYQTKSSLIKSNAELQSKVDELTRANEQLVAQIEELKEENRLGLEVVSELNDRLKDNKDTKQEIIDRRNELISNIRNPEKTQVVVSTRDLTEAEQVSVVNINSLHEAYDAFFGGSYENSSSNTEHSGNERLLAVSETTGGEGANRVSDSNQGNTGTSVTELSRDSSSQLATLHKSNTTGKGSSIDRLFNNPAFGNQVL